MAQIHHQHVMGNHQLVLQLHELRHKSSISNVWMRNRDLVKQQEDKHIAMASSFGISSIHAKYLHLNDLAIQAVESSMRFVEPGYQQVVRVLSEPTGKISTQLATLNGVKYL